MSDKCMTQHELGIYGESLAQDFLIKKKFKIIQTNYRISKAEIDIVCEYDEKLVIVEVKTRQTAEIGEPWKAVTRSKQRQIIKVTNHYINQFNIQKEVRFDVISIIHNSYRTKIEHIENAFSP